MRPISHVPYHPFDVISWLNDEVEEMRGEEREEKRAVSLR
jgi:hypothetical protein